MRVSSAILFVAATVCCTHTRVKAVEADWQEWLISTNKYRCMHDSPFLTWDACMATSAQEWADAGEFQHLDSYGLAPCAGPAGENLAMGQQSSSAAVSDWYSEVSLWTEGSTQFTAGTGHFTALIWKGATKLGCGVNKEKALYVCRYKGTDTKDCKTPNMGGCFADNVPPRNTKTEAECETPARAAVTGSGSTDTVSVPTSVTGDDIGSSGGGVSTTSDAHTCVCAVGVFGGALVAGMMM
eukprot:GDKI01031535.1.p1 GENE.GDKI01031535.1~~GDKI01031535.1.p1  ORF type:complete len:240 (-),score=68.32 GDKI01031535.1:92-811(-)